MNLSTNIWCMEEKDRLNFLKDKIKTGYLREDERRELKRLERVQCNIKLTNTKIDIAIARARAGYEVCI